MRISSAYRTSRDKHQISLKKCVTRPRKGLGTCSIGAKASEFLHNSVGGDMCIGAVTQNIKAEVFYGFCTLSPLFINVVKSVLLAQIQNTGSAANKSLGGYLPSGPARG